MSIPARQFFFFRPGEEARLLARCQFDIDKRGRCVATFTYPTKSLGWRRSAMKSHELPVDGETKNRLLVDVQRLRRSFPSECLGERLLWSDTTESGNTITRDEKTGKLCVRIAVIGEGGELVEDFWMREDSPALVSSVLYKTITELIAPYEKP
jgi:hypothetical protein